MRWYLDGRSGYEAYLAGHIPGAVWADIDRDLAAPAAPVPAGTRCRRPRTSPLRWAGSGSETTTSSSPTTTRPGSIAARLWWMLDSLGVRAYVLDGGISTWIGALDRDGPVLPERAYFTAREWPAGRFVDADEVDALRRDGAAARCALVRALHGRRALGRRRSRPHPGRAQRALDREPRPRDAAGSCPRDVLRRRFAALGVDEGSRAVALCGSGVTACHDLLALRLAGFGESALYAGSWSGWSSDADRPVALGSD